MRAHHHHYHHHHHHRVCVCVCVWACVRVRVCVRACANMHVVFRSNFGIKYICQFVQSSVSVATIMWAAERGLAATWPPLEGRSSSSWQEDRKVDLWHRDECDSCLDLRVSRVEEFPAGTTNSIYIRCGNGWIHIGSIKIDCPERSAIVANIRETMSSWIDKENWTFLRINQTGQTTLAWNAPLKRCIDVVRSENSRYMVFPTNDVAFSTATPCWDEDGMEVDSN